MTEPIFQCPDCGKDIGDTTEPHALDCRKRPYPAASDLPLDVRIQEARYAMFRLLRADALHARLREKWSELETLLDTPASPPSGNAGEGIGEQQILDEAKRRYEGHGRFQRVFVEGVSWGLFNRAAASGNAGERAEPVAWRWKPLGGAWQYAESDARFPDGAGTLQPLFAAPPQPAPDAVREAMREACDLLAERKYGNPARSPGHNARLCLESALRLSAPAQSVQTQAPAQSSPCLRYVNGDAELVCKCVNGKYPEVVDMERRPPTCKAVASHDGSTPTQNGKTAQ